MKLQQMSYTCLCFVVLHFSLLRIRGPPTICIVRFGKCILPCARFNMQYILPSSHWSAELILNLKKTRSGKINLSFPTLLSYVGCGFLPIKEASRGELSCLLSCLHQTLSSKSICSDPPFLSVLNLLVGIPVPWSGNAPMLVPCTSDLMLQSRC